MHFSNVPTSPEYEIYIQQARVGGPHDAPGDYDPFIAEAASKYGVPFSLIKAVISVESDFEPYAVSHAGARGLMQIMPETARDLGVTDAFDPRENIFAGARYLKELLSRFDGDLPLALAAYNAGPDRVGSLGKVPRIRETEGFVRKVMKHLGGD
jgi:soluble lytic murein transglycosylase-like protein